MELKKEERKKGRTWEEKEGMNVAVGQPRARKRSQSIMAAVRAGRIPAASR